MLSIQTQPYVLRRDEGPAFLTVGVLARMKVTGAQTGGAFALVDEWCPPGYETPLHVHRYEDETYYVLDGKVTIFCGNSRIQAEPGTCVFGPRDIAHGFRIVGTEPARILIVANPSGFENFLQEMGEPATGNTLMPDAPPDVERLQAVAAKYGIEVLGPLPA